MNMECPESGGSGHFAFLGNQIQSVTICNRFISILNRMLNASVLGINLEQIYFESKEQIILEINTE